MTIANKLRMTEIPHYTLQSRGVQITAILYHGA